MTLTDIRTRAHVVSRDGTEVAYWTTGDGPPLLLVHGSTADHTRWRPLLPYLEPYAMVCAMDRRGRGASGDGAEYSVERESEDVAAVVDAIAATTGSPVDVLGHSFGGVCAFGAATLTRNIRKLVLYEGWPAPNPDVLAFPPGVAEQMQRLLDDGQREAALEVFFRRVVRMPSHEFSRYRALPAWRARVAAAHTVLRESRGDGQAFDPAQAAKVTVPVLLLVGEDSPDAIKADYETVAAALPDARVVILAGQQHIAIDLVPDVFAERVLAFLGGSG